MPDPISTRTRRAHRLRARLGASKRRAAVVTSAALLSAGAYATMDTDPASVTSAPVAPIHAVSHVEAEPTEAAPLTLLPVDTVDVMPVSNLEASGVSLGEGRASYYGRELAGNPTASGERFDPTDFTAAHRTLPFGTLVRVTHARTGKSVVVRINDRGPFHEDRVIDVSRAAADAIGLTRRGTGTVRMEKLPATRGVRG